MDLDLELLPAKEGDAVLVSWGPPAARHRMLIDGGPATAYPEVSARLREVAAAGPLDLVVLTHIDGDHIEGALLLTNDAGLSLGIAGYWFNGPAQLSPRLGAAEGEMLAALLGARGVPLNAAFGAAAVCAPKTGPRPRWSLPGGLVLTVLGPDPDDLEALRKGWLPALRDGGLVFASEQAALKSLRSTARLTPATTFLSGGRDRPDVTRLARQPGRRDGSASNRSSIVLLAEYGECRLLLAGDATPAALTVAVRRLLAERDLDRLELTAFKLPHHSSNNNITKELLDLLPARHYLFSTDPRKYGHPHDATVAKCLAYGRPGAGLVFNYRTPRTLQWQDPVVLGVRRNTATYPDGPGGVLLSLPSAPTGRS
jgi:hypothetical protein